MSAARTIMVATGTRAEFGLLEPVMAAVRARSDLRLIIAAAGSHLVGESPTVREVEAAFGVDERIPMQDAECGVADARLRDAVALGRGVAGFARAIERRRPEWVVVLGDRIEAFAAAAAGSVGGVGVAHLHGGDRAEGVADEAMRHAITKLAHLHLAATKESAERIVRMGERPEDVHVVGSPSIDLLGGVEPTGDAAFDALGAPDSVLLLHPIGRKDEEERAAAEAAIEALRGRRVLAFAPNLDPGRDGVLEALRASGLRMVEHLPRREFASLLKRIGRDGGVLVGNSSAGLIEAAALGVRVVNIGDRQAGRERAGNVVDCGESAGAVRDAVSRAMALDVGRAHPYGEGRTGGRVAALLAQTSASALVRKRCAY